MSAKKKEDPVVSEADFSDTRAGVFFMVNGVRVRESELTADQRFAVGLATKTPPSPPSPPSEG